jgi:hypothetical protein
MSRLLVFLCLVLILIISSCSSNYDINPQPTTPTPIPASAGNTAATAKNLPTETFLPTGESDSNMLKTDYNININNYDLKNMKERYLLHVGFDDHSQVKRGVKYFGSYFIDINEHDNTNGYYEIDSSSLIPEELENDLFGLSIDGTKILLLSYDQDEKEESLVIYDLINKESLYRYATKEEINRFMISTSPDMNYLLFQSGTDYIYVDIRNKAEQVVFVGECGLISPDGMKTASVEYISGNEYLNIYEILTGKLIETVKLGSDSAFLSQWHSSNKILYYSFEGSFIYDFNTKEIQRIGVYVYEPQMSPDGRYVAYYRDEDAGWFFPLYDEKHWLYKEYGYQDGLYVKDLFTNETIQINPILFNHAYTPYYYKQFPVQWVYVNTDFENDKYRASSLINSDSRYRIIASSIKDDYYPEKVFDGDIRTVWAEEEERYNTESSQDAVYTGEGLGEWVKIYISEEVSLKSVSPHKQFGYMKPLRLSGIRIINGYVKSRDTYNMNNRIKKAEIILSDGTSFIFTLEDDTMDFQTLDFGKEITTRYITIKILEVYKGSKFNDTCISEIELISTDK